MRMNTCAKVASKNLKLFPVIQTTNTFYRFGKFLWFFEVNHTYFVTMYNECHRGGIFIKLFQKESIHC